MGAPFRLQELATVGTFLVDEEAPQLDSRPALDRLITGNGPEPDIQELISSLLSGEGDWQGHDPLDVNSARQKGYGQDGQVAEDPEGFIHGRAAEFATAKDLMDYGRNHSLATGDNGVGAWGDITTGSTPFVAVPRDLIAKRYGSEDAGRGKMVQVIAPSGKSAVIAIGDKGPALANRANNAVLELNPAAKRVLGSGDSGGYRYKFLD